MSMLTKNLAYFALLLFSMNTHALVTDDPCAGEVERFVCLQTLIDQEQQLITARIDYLNTTQGPKGETGPQGPQGLQGEKGDDGYDVYSDFQGFVDKWMDELAEISLGYSQDVEYARARLGLNGYFADDLRVRLGKSHLALSNLNRNPALMGARTYNEYVPTPVYSELFYPETVNGVAIDPLDGYVYSADGLNFYRVTKSANSAPKAVLTTETNDILYGTFTANICDDTVLTTPAYCNKVADIDEMNEMAADPLVVVACSDDCLMHFGIGGDIAAYQVELGFDSPVYALVLSEYIEFLEANRDELIADMQQSIAEELAKISTLSAQIAAESDPDIKADLEAELEATQLIYSGLLGGVPVVEFFSDPANDNRPLRLSVLSANNDVLHMNIMTVLSTLYYRYIHGQLTVTPAQMAALDDFNVEMQKYYRNFIRRWQSKAEALRINYFATSSSSSLASLFASPSTPDFVEEARAQLEGEVYNEQPPALRSMIELAAISAAATSVPVSGLALSSAVVTASSTVGDLLAGVSLLTKGTVSYGAGVAGSAAGPAAIIGVAVIIGIEGGIQAFEQGGKDDRYFALVEADPASFFVRDLTESELATLVYMALLVD